MEFRTQIEESGFAIVPDVFSRDEIDRRVEEIKRLSLKRSRAGVRHAMRVPPVGELATDRKMIDLAREVLGRDAFPFRATLFDKSQTANWFVVWHQDTALPLRLRREELTGWGPWSVKEGIDYAHAPAHALSQVLTLRVSLDDSTVENGPLHVLPGTHTAGVLSDDGIHELTIRVAPVDCVSRKGGVVAMRPLVVHASSKSYNELARRVLHIEYAASELIVEPMQLAVA